MRVRTAGSPRRRLVALLLSLAALPSAETASPAAASAATARDAPCAASVPFRSGTAGYHTFRIPAALQVPGGPLLAFAEGRRHTSADDGDIDLVLRRSFDGGCGWGPLQVVADAGTDTVGNPVPVLDPASGDVVLLTCRTLGGATERRVRSGEAAAGARRVYVQRSADGGATWSPQRDLTASVKPAHWRWYAVGPGHAVALRRGPYRGRLLVPANHTSARTGLGGAHALHSDDGGLSWRVGFVSEDTAAPAGGGPGGPAPGTAPGAPRLNETTLAELPDGRVYLSSRDHSRAPDGARADAYSMDGGRSLAVPFRRQPQIAGPVVQGSVLAVDGVPGKGPLLYSGPSDPRARVRMRVRASTDGGRSWRAAWTVSEDPAGYSDLVRTGAGRIGLLFETGPRTYHDTIRFTRLPARLLSALPALPGDGP